MRKRRSSLPVILVFAAPLGFNPRQPSPGKRTQAPRCDRYLLAISTKDRLGGQVSELQGIDGIDGPTGRLAPSDNSRWLSGIHACANGLQRAINIYIYTYIYDLGGKQDECKLGAPNNNQSIVTDICHVSLAKLSLLFWPAKRCKNVNCVFCLLFGFFPPPYVFGLCCFCPSIGFHVITLFSDS